MESIKNFDSWISESEKSGLDQDLAWCTLKQLYYSSDSVVARSFYLSPNERDALKRAYGKELPRGFAGPEKSYPTGLVLAAAIYAPNVVHHLQAPPYLDGADLVFRDGLVFRCKVANRKVASTFRELIDWMIENIEQFDDGLFRDWVKSPQSMTIAEFKEHRRASYTGKKFGI